jgi:hypothetical protein
MISFSEFITEAKDVKKVSSNTLGVLHELLTGYHLRGGKHMDRHKDANGLSPQEAHDQLKKTISKQDYDKINTRAKAAAEDLKQRVGGKVKSVQWTSKSGDLERATGIKASQTEDASDIVITDPKGRHHGVSLKVSEKKENVPLSNPGMEKTFGAHHILDAHREHLQKKFKALGNLTNPRARKDYVKANPKVKAYLEDRNTETLNAIAEHMHKKMSKLDTKELAGHIRNNILKAVPTPMQQQGHNHIRHTSYDTSSGTAFKAVDPTQNYESVLKDHKNLGVQKSGTSVIFTHKGVPFAKHRIKFENGGDPMSSVKGSGEEIIRKTPAVLKKPTEKMPKDNSIAGVAWNIR